MRISVIIPALNEQAAIGGLVSRLVRDFAEVIVVDGGSTDGTVEKARAEGAIVLVAERGRGRQLRAGAEAATGEAFWFLHADSLPAPGSAAAIAEALAAADAGVFRLRFGGASRAARFMSWVYPRMGLLYGDAGLFVRREAYFAVGGFAPVALFEDVDLFARLRRRGRLVRLTTELTASPRRFEGRLARTWARWIALQGLYWLGVPPDRLARWYR